MKKHNLGLMKYKKGQERRMKKTEAVILTAILVLSLAGCGTSGQSQTSTSGIQAETVQTETQTESQTEDSGSASGTDTETGSGAQSGEGNILIAYFSVMETDGVDTVGGASRVAVEGEVMGNNEYVAKLIQRETGGDLFAIETVQDYPTTHDPLLEFAYNEKAENARPDLISQIENLDQYDTIFLGFPNWNADLPMPLYTFLEEYDFSGKTIIPFTTHGGSGFSRTISTIESL